MVVSVGPATPGGGGRAAAAKPRRICRPTSCAPPGPPLLPTAAATAARPVECFSEDDWDGIMNVGWHTWQSGLGRGPRHAGGCAKHRAAPSTGQGAAWADAHASTAERPLQGERRPLCARGARKRTRCRMSRGGASGAGSSQRLATGGRGPATLRAARPRLSH